MTERKQQVYSWFQFSTTKSSNLRMKSIETLVLKMLYLNLWRILVLFMFLQVNKFRDWRHHIESHTGHLFCLWSSPPPSEFVHRLTIDLILLYNTRTSSPCPTSSVMVADHTKSLDGSCWNPCLFTLKEPYTIRDGTGAAMQDCKD